VEILILIAILVAYIVYMLFNSSWELLGSEEGDEANTAVATEAEAAPAVEETTDEAPAEAETSTESPDPSGYKNPETGELATVPTNYRFAKKWVKQALVDEGLLEKIYKNNELADSKASQAVKKALDEFKALEKYHA